VSANRLRVAVDVTPLAGFRTGIGRYVENLLAGLGTRPELDVSASAFTRRGRDALAGLPPGVRAVHRPVPARLLHARWLRGDNPPAEWLMGGADVVHGTNFVLPPPRRAAGVVTIHDLSFLRFPELVDPASLAYRTLVPRAVSRAAAVLTPTRAIADEVIQTYGLSPEQVHPTLLGVAEDWFEATVRPTGLNLPAEYLLAVGTLEPRKGLDVLLRAYRELLATESSVPPLVLVGPPGWGPELETAGIEPTQLLLPGYVAGPTLRALVAHARLLAFPSRYEGFGLPPLEALASGTPVVASAVPAVVEVLDGAGAMVSLVPVDDWQSLAAALGEALATTPTQTLIAQGRAHARTFTWQRCVEQTVHAYRAAAA
jgi:glycosyltransferase involved in cell wall biosynthesis